MSSANETLKSESNVGPKTTDAGNSTGKAANASTADTTTHLRKRLDIQGLRAIAVILVIFAHIPGNAHFTGGFIGVDIFFVISGFVITALLLRTVGTGATIRNYYLPFMTRRIIRLVPAMAVLIAVTLLLSIVFAPPAELATIVSAGTWAELFSSNFYFLKNFQTYWNPELTRSPFLHTWSLGVEFQTYLLFPLVMFGLFLGIASVAKKVNITALTVLALTGISLISFIYFIYLRDAPLRGIDPTGIAFYTPVTRFWEFGFGILTALAVKRGLVKFSFHPFFALAAWAMLAVGLWQSHTAGGLSWGILLVCLGTAMLIAHGSNPTQNLQTKALGSLPLVWVGDRSYSIYLWHWPLLILSIWVFPQTWWAPLLAIVFTMLLSMASYSLIEQRMRFDRLKSQTRNLIRPALVFATSIALVVATSSVAHAGWYVSPNSMQSLAQPFHESPVSAEAVTNALGGCTTAELSISCDFFDTDAPYIAVIGDSLGYRSFPAVALSAKENGFNAEQMWTGGCSIELDSCPDFVYEFLSTHKIAGIIVAVNFDRASALLNGGERAAGDIAECESVALMDTCQAHVESVDTFTEAAAPGLNQLEAYSANLLVALPFPQQEALLSSCLNPPLFQRWLGIKQGSEPCGSTSVSWQLDRQGLFPGAIESVTTGDEHVTLWNPMDYLCFKGSCPAVIEPEEKIMDDAIHWSPAASRFLYPAFNEFISPLQ